MDCKKPCSLFVAVISGHVLLKGSIDVSTMLLSCLLPMPVCQLRKSLLLTVRLLHCRVLLYNHLCLSAFVQLFHRDSEEYDTSVVVVVGGGAHITE